MFPDPGRFLSFFVAVVRVVALKIAEWGHRNCLNNFATDPQKTHNMTKPPHDLPTLDRFLYYVVGQFTLIKNTDKNTDISRTPVPLLQQRFI